MAGEYREPLILGLRLKGDEALADQVERRDVKLAITHSIRGNVKRYGHLRGLFIEALQAALDNGVDEYYCIKYIDGLKNEIFVPVADVGVNVNADRYYGCGELFFTS